MQLDNFIGESTVDGWDLVIAAVVMIVFWIASRMARRAVLRVCARLKGVSPAVATLAARVVRIGTLLLGVGIVLSILGAPIQPLLSAAVIVGVVAGLTLRGIADNYAAGVAIQTGHLLSIGDEVQCLNYDGVVTEMSGRFVVIETFDGRVVYLSNASLLDDPIVNVSRRGVRRSEIQVRCAIGAATRDEIVELVGATVRAAEGVLAEPAPLVALTSVDAARVTLLVRFWHNSQVGVVVMSTLIGDLVDALHTIDAEVAVVTPPPPPPLTPPATR